MKTPLNRLQAGYTITIILIIIINQMFFAKF